jgi:hypothetical protein
LARYEDYFLTPNQHHDTYLEAVHRAYFVRRKHRLKQAAQEQLLVLNSPSVVMAARYHTFPFLSSLSSLSLSAPSLPLPILTSFPLSTLSSSSSALDASLNDACLSGVALSLPLLFLRFHTFLRNPEPGGESFFEEEEEKGSSTSTRGEGEDLEDLTMKEVHSLLRVTHGTPENLIKPIRILGRLLSELLSTSSSVDGPSSSFSFGLKTTTNTDLDSRKVEI